MKVLGFHNGFEVGCFVVLRVQRGQSVDMLDLSVPVFTVHRVTRGIARSVASRLTHLTRWPGYQVRAINGECDCQGRADLEDLVVYAQAAE